MLYFVVFKEDDTWVAFGLQHCAMAQGLTLDEVQHNIGVILKAYDQMPDYSVERLPAAPAKYWEMFIDAVEGGRILGSSSDDNATDHYALKIAA